MNFLKMHIVILSSLVVSVSTGCVAMNQNAKTKSSYELLPSSQHNEFVDEIVKKLEDNYVDKSKVTSQIEELKNELRTVLTEPHDSKELLAEKLSEALRRIVKDDHLGIRIKLSLGLSSIEQNEKRLKWMNDVNFGIESAHVENGIGYLKLTFCVWPREFDWAQQAAPLLVRRVHDAFAILNDAKALIIDLRDNEGGSPEMVAAITSFIVDTGIGLSKLRWRDPQGKIFKRLENSPKALHPNPNSYLNFADGITTEKFTTVDEEALFGIKSKLKNVPVAVLTNSQTFSAGEEFAYNLKQRERAKLFGETTKGGANPNQLFALAHDLEILIPCGEAVNPISRTNWEGKGVEPDVKVASEEALTMAKTWLSDQIK